MRGRERQSESLTRTQRYSERQDSQDRSRTAAAASLLLTHSALRCSRTRPVQGARRLSVCEDARVCVYFWSKTKQRQRGSRVVISKEARGSREREDKRRCESVSARPLLPCSSSGSSRCLRKMRGSLLISSLSLTQTHTL